MSTTTRRAHRASEVGWSGFGISVPFVLLGRGGVLAFLVLWTFGPYIPLDSLRDMLTLALGRCPGESRICCQQTAAE